MASDDPVVVTDVSFAYGGRPVLRKVNVGAAAGFTVILGANGSGKSTLIQLLAGLLTPDSGSVSILGRPSCQARNAERARLVGYLPQFHQPVFPFTVEQVVLTGRASYVTFLPAGSDLAHVRRALDEVGLSHLAGQPYTTLSGGERQLVMVARVLAQDPQVILLDEPTAHLDLANTIRLLELLTGLKRRGKTIVAVLHDPNTASLYADQFILLKDGVAETTNALEADRLSEVFGLRLQLLELAPGQRVVLPVVERCG